MLIPATATFAQEVDSAAEITDEKPTITIELDNFPEDLPADIEEILLQLEEDENFQDVAKLGFGFFQGFLVLALIMFALIIFTLVFWILMLVHASRENIPHKTAWIVSLAIAGLLSLIVFPFIALIASLVYYFAVKKPHSKIKGLKK
jgi:hypothetical protein